MPGTLSMNALLSQALLTLTEEFGGPPSLGVVSNVLRPIGDGIPVRDLPAAARLSKRTVRAALGAAEKSGYLVPQDKSVYVTPAGEQARTRQVDDRWPQLADPLRAIVSRLYLEWPHYPTGYGPADFSITGGVYTAGGGQIDSRVPTHADDWSPVLRHDRDGSSVEGLPISALLSQALVAFAADFEELWIGGLHHAATVLQFLPDEGAPISDFPMLRNLPGNGKSVLERHGYIEIIRDGKVKLAVPTARGRNTRDEYPATVERVESRWGPKYGADAVSSLRAELEALDVDRELPHMVIDPLVS